MVASGDPVATDLERSSERWLAWLAAETTRQRRPPRSDLLVLWDLLEDWFASDDFAKRYGKTSPFDLLTEVNRYTSTTSWTRSPLRC